MAVTLTEDSKKSENPAQASFLEELNLQYYLRILRKNKWAIAIFTMLVTSLATYYAYNATPIYRSASTLLIESQKANIVSIEELYGVETDGDYYETQYELLRSRGLAVRVVKRLGLDTAASQQVGLESTPSSASGSSSWLVSAIDSLKEMIGTSTGSDSSSTASLPDDAAAASPSVSEDLSTATAVTTPTVAYSPTEIAGLEDNEALDLAVRNFRDNLSISPVRKTKLVKISYESPDPVFAALAANVVAEEYILSVLDGRMKLKEKASTWMNERIAVLKSKLDESEQRLIAFKQENGLIDVNGSVGRLNEQELLLATTELAQAKSELSDAQDLYREVTSLQRSAPELLETVSAIQNDPLVRSVKIEFGQRQREFDELSNRYGARHPKIVDAQSRLDSLRSTMDGHVSRVIGAIEKDYQLRRQRVSSIQASLNKGKENIQVIGQKKFQLDALEREVEANRDIYNELFGRITETNSSDGLDAANARISDYAVRAALPIKPKKQIIIALAALGSLLLSMLMAFLYEQMDETIKGTHDVEKRLGVRLLGILPLINTGRFGRKKELPLNPLEIDDKRGTFIEAVNTARTALSINGGETNQVILVTSSTPGEGKSTTSLNIAHSFSQLERVLLIDCDMRRPSLAKAIGLTKNAEGLSNLITKTASARDCIRRNAVGALDILTSGPTPNQPLELISSNRFAKILDQLKLHYDKIIIDSAPTQAVSDALVLSQLSDAVVYVVKSHGTPFDLVQRGIARLNQVEAPIAGVLMTQVDINKISAYGGDYYYQGYFDYYGYTDKSDSNNGKGKIKLTPEELRQMKLDDEDVELDLGDYVRRAPSQRRQEMPQTGSNARNQHHDFVDDVEFDLTSQVQRQQAGNTRRRSTSDDLYKDDLDLV